MDAVIACYEKITPRVMDALPNLKLAAYKSIRFNNIDLDYTTVIELEPLPGTRTRKRTRLSRLSLG